MPMFSAITCIFVLLSSCAFASSGSTVEQIPDSKHVLSSLRENSISYTLGFRTTCREGEVSCYTIYDGPDNVHCLIFTNCVLSRTVMLDSTPMEIVVCADSSKLVRKASFDMAAYVESALLCTNFFGLSEYVSSCLLKREEYKKQKHHYDYGLTVVAAVCMFVAKITGQTARNRRKYERAREETLRRYSVEQIAPDIKRDDVENRLGKPLAQTTEEKEPVIYVYGPPKGYPSGLRDSCTCGIAYKDGKVDTVFAGSFLDFRLLDDRKYP